MTELCINYDSKDIKKLKNAVMDSKRYKKLLNCLRERKEHHGANLYAVENPLNMLIDMGIRYKSGFFGFDEVLEQIANEAQKKPMDKNHVLGQLSYIVIVPFLLRAGMREQWMLDFMKGRLATIHKFVVKRQYDIYEDISKYKAIPDSFKNRPIIKEVLYENGDISFPLEYDIYGFASIYHESEERLIMQIDDVIAYIMDGRFHGIEDGYGILHKQNKYWAMGWDPKPTDLSQYYKYNELLLKLDLLSNFPDAISTEWFASAIEYISQYRDEKGLYHFTKEYLTEKDSCWILENHIGLGENRRKKEALVVEGTFRMLSIMKKIENNRI